MMKILFLTLIFSFAASASMEQTDQACNSLYRLLKFESSAQGFIKAFPGSNSKGEHCQVKVMINNEHSCAIFIAPEGKYMEAIYLHYTAKFPVLNILDHSIFMTAHMTRFETGPITNIPWGRHREILTLETDEKMIKVNFETKTGFRLRTTESVYDCTAYLDSDN
jgi:hypothetical protein